MLHRIALLAVVVIATASTTHAAGADVVDHHTLCALHHTDVVVDASERHLLLCQGGVIQHTYTVNLGGGGLGKTKQGDRKTPLGTYALSPPRASSAGFTWFVPIGYPTASQRTQGYTGGAIGIHGPPDWIPQVAIDIAFATPWTDGCIMVRTTAEIAAIRQWMLAHKPKTIAIVE